ncbi:saccharopine dehydrogenase NADP-binding domain-containing protein [Mycobacterium sp. MYCO198283]|uniref:saccharopine dehydrogenase family protein n=1 Tax=Mycobacterium sp. MYCO198283 TaxID=2883505 RepID=UPI001E5444AA|nr:saccharopine dehydrogenase NADP-binding domain-containing protein [Mycobacterium sp. MYCO198283]MCG5433603.1 saccharopine dehydrogenase NADP-binding domain-containing protein [Mycobacterium sp. MYCO198283]
MTKIVLYGATGYTGRLTAAALVRRGLRPVLAGRNAESLRALADSHGGLPVATADASDAASVAALVERGDVLLTTVGPFSRFGRPAAQAAVDAGAHYLDSTGEPVFIRTVFEDFDGPARAAQITMLTAFGYDYVPGNLAAGLALAEAGDRATAVDVGYFIVGPTKASKGTITSAAQALLDPGFGYRDGRLTTEPMGRDLLKFTAGGKTQFATSLAASEQFSLPRVYPSLRDVRVGIGMGPATPAVWAASRAAQLGLTIPGARDAVRRTVIAKLPGSGGGPDDEYNARSSCRVIAVARSAGGDELATVTLRGPAVYPLTAELLAWGADQLAAGAARSPGALGPVEAFGLDELERGCASLGLRRA